MGGAFPFVFFVFVSHLVENFQPWARNSSVRGLAHVFYYGEARRVHFAA